MCTIGDLLELFWSLKELRIDIYDPIIKKVIHVRKDMQNLSWNNDHYFQCEPEIEYLAVSPYRLPNKYKKLKPDHLNVFSDSLIIHVSLHEQEESSVKSIEKEEADQLDGQLSLEDL